MVNQKPTHNPHGAYCDCSNESGLHEFIYGDCIDDDGDRTDDKLAWLLHTLETAVTESPNASFTAHYSPASVGVGELPTDMVSPLDGCHIAEPEPGADDALRALGVPIVDRR